MQKPLLKLLGASLVCVPIAYFAWLDVVNAVMLGIVLWPSVAVLLLLWILAARRRAKDLHYRHLNGRHYAFHTQPIEVDEGDEHDRWIRIASIRQVLKNLPANPVLKRIFQDQMTDGPAASIHVDALIDYLRRAHDPRSIQFKLWLEREVSLPAQNRKKRHTRTA